MLYRDRLIELSERSLTIKHYYFPLATARIVPLDDIVRVQAFEPGFANGRFRLWGTGAPDVWFARDWRRPVRDWLFRVRLHSQRIEPGFSAERPEELKSVLAARGLLAT